MILLFMEQNEKFVMDFYVTIERYQKRKQLTLVISKENPSSNQNVPYTSIVRDRKRITKDSSNGWFFQILISILDIFELDCSLLLFSYTTIDNYPEV